MLSPNTMSNLKTLLDAVVQEAAEEYSRAVGTLTVKFVGQGVLHSSGFTLSVDELAANAIKQAGDKLMEQAIFAHAAETSNDSAARGAQLVEAVSSALAEIGNRLAAVRNARLKPIPGMPRGTLLEQTIPTALARTLAKLQLSVAATNNKHTGQTTTINVNGSVGALQTGNHSVASVVQYIHMPDSQDALQALERIEGIVKNALEASTKAEILEMLEDLKEQTRRERPNPVKVSSLIGGMGGIIQTIPNISPAWNTVVAWAAMIRKAVTDIAGS